MKVWTQITTRGSILAACAFTVMASGGGDAPSTSTSPSYATLSATASDNITLGGASLRSQGANTQTLAITGSITSGTQRTRINDGTFDFIDTNGEASNGSLVTSSGWTMTRNTNVNQTGYQYTRVYDATYGSSAMATVVAGNATLSAHMPSSGTATYTGRAAATVISGTDAYSMENGTTTVNANFGTSGRATVTMNGFTVSGTPTSPAAPVNTIVISNASISSGRITGGTITTRLNNTDVNLTGSNTVQQTSGAFFGYSGNAPAEVGGVFSSEGDNGSVQGVFIAKR